MQSSGVTPVKNLALFGVLLYAVNSPLVEVVTGCRFVTSIHNPAFGAPFIIKIIGGELLERLLQNVLTYRNQTMF